MTDRLPPPLVEQARSTMRDLRAAHLTVTTWPAVAGDLARLAAALERRDAEAVDHALLPVSRVAYEGKVRRRLAGAGGRAAVVSATKSTSSLPLVGAVCGAIVMALGYALGGIPVLIGTAVFALFIFGVAVAGTRTNAERTEDRVARRASPTREALEPAPGAVREVIRKIESQLEVA